MLEAGHHLENSTIDRQLNIPYNSKPDCPGIDIYGAKAAAPKSQIFAFVHGGFWIVKINYKKIFKS